MTSERVDVLVIGSGAAGGATVDSKAWSRVAVLLLLLTCALSSAQTRSDRSGRLARAEQTDHPLKMDGTLDDPVWLSAPPVDDFRQKEPLETQPATERTEVRIAYDSRYIYFGIHCYDACRHCRYAAQTRLAASSGR